MTISITTARVDYVGNGITTSFPVPFPFFGEAELQVIERTIATGAETIKTLSTHYTVSGGNGATGTVTAGTAPADTVQWTIRRNTARTQATAYPSNSAFPSASHERALDRLTAQVQEIEEKLSRALMVPASDAVPGDLASSVDREGRIPVGDADGGFEFRAFPEYPENVPNVYWGGNAGGSANAITLTTTPAISAYGDGQSISFIASASNTGATTVNVNGLGAVTIYDANGSALGAGAIVNGQLTTIEGLISGGFRLKRSGTGRDIPFLDATSPGSPTYGLAYSATTTTAPAEYEPFFLRLDRDADTGAELTINGGTARQIRRETGGALSRSDVRASIVYPAQRIGTIIYLSGVNNIRSLTTRLEFLASSGFVDRKVAGDSFHRERALLSSSGVDLVAGGTGASSDAITVARAQADGDFRAFNRLLTGTPVAEVHHPGNPPPVPWEDIGDHLNTVQGPQHEGAVEPVTTPDADPSQISATSLGRHRRVTFDGAWVDCAPVQRNTSDYVLDFSLAGTFYLWAGLDAIWRGTNDALAKSNTEFTSVTSDAGASTFTFAGGNPVSEGLGRGDVIRFANLAATANNGVDFTILDFSGGSNRTVKVAPAPVTDAVADSAFTVTRQGSRTLALTLSAPGFYRILRGQADIGLSAMALTTTRANVIIPDYGERGALAGQSWADRMAEVVAEQASATRRAWKDGDPDPSINTGVWLIDGAAGASTLLKYAPSVSTNYWWNQDTDAAGPNVTAFLATVSRHIAHMPSGQTLDWVCFVYGLNDMNQSVWASTGSNTPAIWTAMQLSMQAYIRTQLGLPNLKFLITPVPGWRAGTFTEQGFNAMRQAQLDVIAADPTGTFRGPPAHSLIKREKDNHHGFQQQGLWGSWLPKFTSAALGTRTEELGPRIVDFTEVSSSEYVLEIEPTSNAMIGRDVAIPNGVALWDNAGGYFGDPVTRKKAIRRFLWGTSGGNHTLTMTPVTPQAGLIPIYPYGSGTEFQAPKGTIRDGVTLQPLLEHRTGDYVT